MKNFLQKNYKQIHFITSLKTGGAENMIFKYVKYSKNKENILVVSLGSEGKYSKKIQKLEVDICHLNLENKITFSLIRLILKIILQRPNSLIGWMYHGNLFATFIFFLNIIFFSFPKLHWNIRQTIYNIKNEKKLTRKIIYLNKILSYFPNKIIYNSNKSIEQHRQIGFNHKKTIFIPNGFEIHESFKKNNKDNNLNLLISNKIVISHIARLHEMKNHKLIFEIAKKIIKNNDNVIFIFCGLGINIKNRSFRKKFNFNYLNSKNMFFFDEINDVNKILKFSNIFILTSSWGEGFPNIIGEAMLNKCQIISTNVGDVKEIINGYGSIVEKNNKSKLIFYLEKMIKSKNLNKNYGAFRTIKKKYDIIEIAKKFDTEFK